MVCCHQLSSCACMHMYLEARLRVRVWLKAPPPSKPGEPLMAHSRPRRMPGVHALLPRAIRAMTLRLSMRPAATPWVDGWRRDPMDGAATAWAAAIPCVVVLAWVAAAHAQRRTMRGGVPIGGGGATSGGDP